MKVTSTTLANGQTLQFGDFNVFIGGNGVGKTTLMAELFSKSSGRTRRRFFWISNPTWDSTDVKQDIELLKGSMAREYDGANVYYYSTAAKSLEGNPDKEGENRWDTNELAELDKELGADVFGRTKYRRPFVVYSSCDARLGLQDRVDVTGLNQVPSDPINVLYRNKKVLRQIDSIISERFGIHFLLLDHTRTNLQLGTAIKTPPAFDYEAESLQEEFEKVESWSRDHFNQLSEAGHGIRSMIRLLTSLAEPVNTVLMIDEPEMHLYPAQKRWLGRELVRLAREQRKQVFLVTHDAIFLQGILDANTKTSIFRVSRDDERGARVDSCELREIVDTNAMRNQEQFLQGLFYQRCVVVEGASDRSFYQSMLDDLPAIADKDIGFVACGGVGATKHVAHLVSKVGLKAAFIYDFDALLFELETMKEVFQLMGGLSDVLARFEEALNAEPAVAAAAGSKTRTQAIKAVTGYSPKGGISGAWAEKNRSLVKEAIEQLGSRGVFLVPHGSLESWAPDVEPKIRFAEYAPREIRGNAELQAPLHTFLDKVSRFLGVSGAAAVAPTVEDAVDSVSINGEMKESGGADL